MFLPETVPSDFFSARAVLVTDAAGRDEVLVVAKAAWSVPVGGSPVPAPTEVETLALLFEERAGSSIRVPSDLAPEKPGTEIILVGHARHPAAYPDARYVDVTLAVEAERALLEKRLRVFGPRRWIEQGGTWSPSEPERYEETPLRWEWAYGGASDGGADPRNPIGRGFGARAAGDPCHAIEYADRDPGSTTPAAFAPIAPHWAPRGHRAGSITTDDLAPHPPADRDPRHYCVAPDDQWLASPLQGGETIFVTGVHARAAWTFTLPEIHPEMRWTIRERAERATPHLDTVFLDADAELVTLSWRARFPAPRNLADLESIAVSPRRSSALSALRGQPTSDHASDVRI
ncbi:MAG: DUF2169 domain-containing protein [Polyangiaceae bacterium]|nr:DUF2169 domain-containing protein [Polyangiaceae bacterium]